MIYPNLSFEQQYSTNGPVCGVDEVGRGPLAGPVTAAAVILGNMIPAGLNDSKKLTAKRRDALYEDIMNTSQVGIGAASVSEIDEINILQASFLAMRRAMDALPTRAGFALIDGNKVPKDLYCEAAPIIKGDGKSLSIAAASIVAKVTRDRQMVALAQQFPGYAWERNMGYGTKAHMEGLNLYGVTLHHRSSFAPIHKILVQEVYLTP